MLCSISGTVPEEPVVSKKSGLLFERRLVEKVVQETGRCPVTDEPLDKDDLLVLSTGTTIKPRPITATSIPGLLSLFQNEWDATMLEAHQLRQALHTTRQELSHALYQHDAATRVIARLIRERDAFRAQAETAQLAAPAAAADAANGKPKRGAEGAEVEEVPAGKKARAGLAPAVVDALTACSTALSKGRKKRAVPPGLAAPEDLSSYTLQGSHPLHSTRRGGVLAIATAPGADEVVATAGADATVQVFDRAAQRSLASLKGHGKKVMDVAFVGSRSLLASASADKTVRLWRAAEGGGGGDGGDADDAAAAAGYECAAVLEGHGGEVVSVCVHPTNDYLVTAAADATWAMYDVASAQCLARVAQEDAAAGAAAAAYTSGALHPDGLIIATGAANGLIHVWEARTQKQVAKFEADAHTAAVSSLSFSENGYYLASAAADGVKIWDLRKLKNVQSLQPYGEGEGAAPSTCVSFDRSGLYLGVGGADARVYGVKHEWQVLKEFGEVPKKGVSAVAWGADARALLVGGADHNLRVFGASA